MKRLMLFVVGLVFLFTGSVFAVDKPAAAAPEKAKEEVAAPVKAEKKEMKKEVKKVKKAKKAKKAKKEKKVEEAAPAPAAPAK